eukprot:2549002-Pyramimonas_sp.AAC.2
MVSPKRPLSCGSQGVETRVKRVRAFVHMRRERPTTIVKRAVRQYRKGVPRRERSVTESDILR